MSTSKKIRLYRCKHIENECDDLGKYAWCQNKDCPTRECWCDNIFQMAACPCFSKQKDRFIDCDYYTEKHIKEMQQEFLKKLEKDISESYSKMRDEMMRSIETQNRLAACLQTVKGLKS